MVVLAKDKIPLKTLQNVMQEGENKGFSELPIEEVHATGDICIKAN